MYEAELELDLDELSSAEDFLDYFEIAYDPAVVHVNRLHMLQRYHDYLGKVAEMPADEMQRRAKYQALLQQAYDDFVHSDAQTEKVLKVYRMNEPQQTFVPLSELTMQVKGAS